MHLPHLNLISSEGKRWDLAQIAQGKAIVYVYPATGMPGTDPAPGWDEIPGAPGCTLQSLGFRDHYQEFHDLGYAVFGISAQSSAEQAEFKQRTHLPLQLVLLSDQQFLLRDKLGLPTFDAHGKTFYKRLAMVWESGQVRQMFYPVHPPDKSAAEILKWLNNQIT